MRKTLGPVLSALSALALLLLTGLPLQAQTLQEEFAGLFTFGDCGEPLCLPVNASVHGNHYNPDVVQGQDNLLAFLGAALATSVGNVPTATATSGVTFRFEGGVPVAEEVSAGPIFAERAQTLGQGRLFVGANLTGVSFDEVRGLPTSGLELVFVHENVGDAAFGDPFFEGDVIEVEADMELSVQVATLFATYGLLENVDLGVIVPLVNASLEGTSLATVRPVPGSTVHAFGTQENPSSTATSSADASAVGIGDVGARLKVGLRRSPTLGVALLGDVRLPTGDEEDFLGSGETTVRGLVIVSGRRGNFYPHLNAGFLVNGAENQPNAALATVGFDQLLTPWATLAVELITSWQVGDGIEFPQEARFDVPAGRVVDLTNIPDGEDHLIDLSVGAKFTTGSGLRVVTNAFLPVNSGGLRPSLGWTVGLEYDFF
jgi:hypothetical protein